ncbi:MAG: 50S ribosomal protein L11 methyltransferase [Chloroflexota bacterium]
MRRSPEGRRRWLQVAITLDGELAEPVADLLARLAPGGVALESARIEDNQDEGQPVGPVTVRAFLPEDDALPERRRQLEERLWHLSQICPLPSPSYTPLEDSDWSEAWKAHYRPLAVGRRLLILPAWLSAEPGDRLPLLLDPGMAFGTGTHPTTQLMLTALEDYLRPGDPVADLGCGSGVLSIAAVLLGAASVLALDIDEEAIALTRQNAARNGVTDRIRVEHGSHDLLRRPDLAPPGGFPLVLANILASVLERMLQQGLVEAVRPRGRLLLSGILEAQAESLQRLAVHSGLRLVETRSQEDWRLLVLERRLPPHPEAA